MVANPAPDEEYPAVPEPERVEGAVGEENKVEVVEATVEATVTVAAPTEEEPKPEA